MNYNKFYNAWQGFTKPKRQLLLEEDVIENIINLEKMNPEDFLRLTTDEETLKSLINLPSITGPYKASMAKTLSLTVKMEGDGIAKVVRHEGRNRSVAASKANQPVKVDIYVLNDYATLEDISAFKGQLTDVVIPTEEIIRNAEDLKSNYEEDAEDPLDIGSGRDFSGYIAPPLSRGSNEKVHNYLEHSYSSDRKMNKLGARGFVELLNKLYSVTDGEQDYQFAFTGHVYFDRLTGEKRPPSGMRFINLSPHPVEVYGSEEAANKKIYTIKKKSAE